MQEVGLEVRLLEGGVLVTRVLSYLRYPSTPVSSWHVHHFNDELERDLLEELAGGRSRIVEEELNYG